MSRQTAEPAFAGADEDTEIKVLREYYTDLEFFLSIEWLLKVVAVMVCMASAALFVRGGCSGLFGLGAGGAGVALASGAAAALLCAAAALQLPPRAPRAWLVADLIISTVMGILLLVTAILSMVFCEMDSVSGYLHGPLAITNAALVTGSAVVTYRTVTKRIDAARPRVEPRRPAPLEQEA